MDLVPLIDLIGEPYTALLSASFLGWPLGVVRPAQPLVPLRSAVPVRPLG